MRRRTFLSVTALSGVCVRALGSAEADPWPASQILDAPDLARRISAGSPPSLLLYVGFPVLYRAAHIPGAILAGPCSKPQGLADLHERLTGKARDSEIVLYCGCCPLAQCPNLQPAWTAVHALGFTNLKVLRIPTNLHADWTAKGYPVEKS